MKHTHTLLTILLLLNSLNIFSQNITHCLNTVIKYHKNTQINIKKANKLSEQERLILTNLINDFVDEYKNTKSQQHIKFVIYDSAQNETLQTKSEFYLNSYVENKGKIYTLTIELKDKENNLINKFNINATQIGELSENVKSNANDPNLSFGDIIEKYYSDKKNKDNAILFKPYFTIINAPGYLEKDKVYEINITLRDCDGELIPNTTIELSVNNGTLDTNKIITDKYGNSSLKLLTEKEGWCELKLQVNHKDILGNKTTTTHPLNLKCISEYITMKAFVNVNISSETKKIITTNKYETIQERDAYEFATFLKVNYQTFLKIINNQDSLLSETELENFIIGNNVLELDKINVPKTELNKDLDLKQISILSKSSKYNIINDTIQKLISEIDTMCSLKYNYIECKIVPFKKEKEAQYSFAFKMQNSLLGQLEDSKNFKILNNYLFMYKPIYEYSDNDYIEIIKPITITNDKAFVNFIEKDNKARTLSLNGAYYKKTKETEINQAASIQIRLIKLSD